jgi:ribonuclease BN (tRNA processing enzyme)
MGADAEDGVAMYSAAILNIADHADILFIETAAKKYHLTTRQAATLAREAQAKRMVSLFITLRNTRPLRIS